MKNQDNAASQKPVKTRPFAPDRLSNFSRANLLLVSMECNKKLGGGFKYFLVLPRSLGK